MILADTSVWVDHLRRGDAQLRALLESSRVLAHPFVIGEIACRNLADRAAVLELLCDMPMAAVADAEEVLAFIDRHRLHGRGLGYVRAPVGSSCPDPGCQVMDARQALARDRGDSRLRTHRGWLALNGVVTCVPRHIGPRPSPG